MPKLLKYPQLPKTTVIEPFGCLAIDFISISPLAVLYILALQ